GGKTYRFKLHPGVRYSPPFKRSVRPSDIKYAIERLYHVNSPGVGFYSDLVGAETFGKTLKGGIKGIVANDKKLTIVFRLQHPDGAFLDILAMPFAFAVPKGMPYKDISTNRLSQLKARYAQQVHLFPRNNDSYFLLNERKYPFTKLAVRQAANYATDRNALVKIYGGQGQASETVVPPGFGSAYKEHSVYPHDLAKARALVKHAGAHG